MIACASQGPRQLITEGGDGILTPIDDAKSLAEAIGHLLAEPAAAQAMAQAGRKAYEECFTESAVVARYLDFFDKVKR